MLRTLTLAAALACAALSVSTLVLPTIAVAQRVPKDSFAIQRFVPAAGAGNYLMVDGTTVGDRLSPTLGLLVDFAHRPFVLRASTCLGGNTDDCTVRESKADIVRYQLTFNAMATLALWQRLQLGLVLPVVASGGESFSAPAPNLPDEYLDIRGGDAFGLGDPRLSAKLRITDAGAAFGVALVGFVSAPLGEVTAEGYRLGDPGPTAGGHLVLELGTRPFRAAANLGARYRPHRELLSTEVGSELNWGVAAGWQLTPLLRLLGEVTGANRLSAQLDENPVEARVAAELLSGDFALLLGGGTGVIGGVGVPDVRVLAGVSYRPQGLDGDGDGVGDRSDACPTEREDRDGHQDADGCPDSDNDGDRLPDGRDRCPDEAEDRDGQQDDDGCPDSDDDADGVPDGYDSCPREAEDKDGDRDDDGCPEDDRDHDGIGDASDKCPAEAEDTDGLGDDDGCPDVDFDHDGLPDDEDQCAEQAEDRDGYQDDDGCPEDNPAAPGPRSPARRSQGRR